MVTDTPHAPIASRPTHDLLKGKIAVITGAGTGIGKATAEVFVAEGAKVLVADVSGAETQTALELGDSAVSFHVDMTNESDIEAMFARAREVFGRVDVLGQGPRSQARVPPGMAPS